MEYKFTDIEKNGRISGRRTAYIKYRMKVPGQILCVG